MPNLDAAYWKRHFAMERHPEGGWWAPNYAAADTLMPAGLPKRYQGERLAGTAIYFLLEQGDFSAIHRLQSDEIWHWYAGSPLQLSWINATGMPVAHRLGPNPENLEAFQVVVPHNSWMAAETVGAFSLFGCTLAPGFHEEDFELGDKETLLARYPQHAAWIAQYTR